MRSVADLKDSVAGLLTGTNLDNTTNLDGAIERSARTLVQKAYVNEASGRQPYMIYDQVFDYLAPETIFGGSIVDFAPQGVDRTPLDQVYRQQIEAFDQTKCYLPNGVQLTFTYQSGVPIVRVAETRAKQAAVLDWMNATSGWAAGGSASGLAVDSTVYYRSPGSLRFNLAGAGTGYIEKTLSNPLNLSTYERVGVAFLAFFTPSATSLTDLSVRIGSSSADYDSLSVTEGFLGAWLANDFLLAAFDMSLASSAGTPDWSAIDYIRASATTSAGINNLRFGGLFIALPSPYEMLYQSAAIFLESDGTLSETITSDNDLLTLNSAAYTLMEYETALGILLQNGGSITAGLAQEYNNKLNAPQGGLYALYRARQPSQEISEIGSWE